MAKAKRIPKPTEVGKGEYKPQSTMTPEQQSEAAKKHKDAQARARDKASKKYQPQPNVEPERLGGGLTEAEMNVKAPGPPTVVRQQARTPGQGKAGRLERVTPKKYQAPKAALGRKGPGQRQREAKVDLKTGKPKPQRTLGQRYITDPMERAVGKIPASWRVSETGARAPRTMSERLGSIGRTATRGMGGRDTPSRPGGLLNIPEEAAKTKGPSLEAQRGTAKAAAKRRAAMSLGEKQRKGMRVTAADVPEHGKGPTPVGTTIKAGGAPGPAKVKTIRGRTEGGDLGEYKVTGYVPPKPEPRVVQKKKGYQPPKRAETVREIWGSLFGKKKK